MWNLFVNRGGRYRLVMLALSGLAMLLTFRFTPIVAFLAACLTYLFVWNRLLAMLALILPAMGFVAVLVILLVNPSAQVSLTNTDWYSLLFRLRLPCFLSLGRGVSFNHMSQIEIGKWLGIGDFVTPSGLGKDKLVIGDGCSIGSVSRGKTTFNLGEHIHLGHYMPIGTNTITGQYFSVHPENHRFDDPNLPICQQGTERKPVRIGENCWLGAKVTVAAGVTISNNCVIGAGSLVIRDIPDNSVAVGNPARVIRSLQ
jgi:acetyltransferase-like isoleucine patch superfamily enzyme